MQGEALALADAIVGTARTVGATTPAVRGADWQIAIVTAVNTTAGTVDCDTIRARRVETYQSPAIGDKIVITNSGSGNWVAWGRTSTGADTAWTQVTLAAGFSHNGNSQGNVRYRKQIIGGTPVLQWRGGLGVTYPSTGNFLSSALPAAARPADLRTVPAACSASTSVQNAMKIDFKSDGTAQVVGFTTGGTNNPPWISLNGIQYPLDA